MEKNRYELTENELSIVEKARDILLQKFNISSSRFTAYFTIKDEEIGGEYDTCDSDKCIKYQQHELNQLKKKKKLPKGIIKSIIYSNDGDYDNVERCSICEKPLNEWLTWIHYELVYFTNEIEKMTLEIVECNHVELYVIFNSVNQACDYQREPNYEREKKMKQSVVKLAEFVIEVCKSGGENK